MKDITLVAHFTLSKNLESIRSERALKKDKIIHRGLGEKGKGQFGFLGFDLSDPNLIRKFMRYFIRGKNAGGRLYLNRDAVCIVFEFRKNDWLDVDLSKSKINDFLNSNFSEDEFKRIGSYLMSPNDVQIIENENFKVISFKELSF